MTSPQAEKAALTAALQATLPSANNLSASNRRAKKAREAAIALRTQLWPQLAEDDIWTTSDRRRVGFAQVPRVLSLTMGIINSVAKRQTGKALPAGRTYLALWLHVFGEGLVKVDSEEEIAYEAGYAGERGRFTFRSHMRTLREQGFIDYQKGPKGPFHFVLLFNPYKVVRRLYSEKLVSELEYAAFKERAHAVGSSGDLGE